LIDDVVLSAKCTNKYISNNEEKDFKMPSAETVKRKEFDELKGEVEHMRENIERGTDLSHLC